MLKRAVGFLAVCMLLMPGVLSVCSMVSYKPLPAVDHTAGDSERSLTFFGTSSNPLVQETTDHFSDSIVIITGKSNTVASTSLWLFGFKCMVIKRVTIQANNLEGETINVLVLPPTIGLYFDYESISIQLNRVTGLFFWGKRSVLFESEPPQIVAVCKARDIWVTYG